MVNPTPLIPHKQVPTNPRSRRNGILIPDNSALHHIVSTYCQQVQQYFSSADQHGNIHDSGAHQYDGNYVEVVVQEQKIKEDKGDLFSDS